MAKVGILGASGRVGRELTSLLSVPYEYDGIRLELGPTPKRISSQPPAACAWIDFSRPEGTLSLLKSIHTPILIATTGFSDEQKKEIQRYATEHPVILASNTSPGLNVFRALLGALPGAERFPMQVLLEEEHHKNKVDAPSGTAKTLLSLLAGKGFKNVETHVVRAGDIIGTHRIRFIGSNEELEITHRVSHRRVFAEGALQAAAFLLNQPAGLYDMSAVFSGRKT